MTVPVTQDAPTTPSTLVQAQAMWQSSIVTEMLHVAADHGVFALLLDGPSTSSVLAAATGVHERSLHRLLRAMAGLGLCASSRQGWTLTPLGTAAAKLAGPSAWALPTIPQLGRAVETGRPAMTFSHGGTIFEYFAAHPDEGAEFDARLAVINAAESRAVTEAYALVGVNRLVDVGGGNGAFLAEVLRNNAELHGVLFDLPRTVANPSTEFAEFGGRCQITAGDFFEAVPTDGDAYLLSHIVHDWPEPQAVAILTRVREAIAPSGRVLLVEMVMPSDDTPHPARMLDMVMLLLTGGEERTEDEYADLLARAGFRLERVIPTRSPVSVLEAIPC
jgi:hypothetical protein